MQVIIDERVDKEILKFFEDLGYEINKVKKQKGIYNEISSHTDIFVLKVLNTVVSSGNVFEKDIPSKYTSIYGGDVGNSYPDTAKYNVCLIGEYAIHNFKITDKVLLDFLKHNNYKLINVKQGYSRCNILPLGNKSLVTSDKGIYNVLSKNGFDVLYLSHEDLDIKLYAKDLEYSSMQGFIGGCSFVLENVVVFFGDLDNFRCKERLVDYIKSKGFEIKDFKNMDIIDYGSCIFLD